jgi:hypothetical protein
MMLCFNMLTLLFSALYKVCAYRAGRLERKFARLAKEVYALSHSPLFKEGNANRIDPYEAARRQYLLGNLLQKQDRLEALHDKWAQRAEKMERQVARLRQWKGRLVPYAFGALDTVGVACLVDYLTYGDVVRLRQWVEWVQSWFTA